MSRKVGRVDTAGLLAHRVGTGAAQTILKGTDATATVLVL